MKKLTLILLLIGAFTAASASHWVSGYFRSNGTYVPGHWRSDPNGIKFDNYSTYGNVNPYTGKIGTKRIYDDDYFGFDD